MTPSITANIDVIPMFLSGILLDHAPIAIVSTDSTGGIVTWNRGAETLFQRSKNDAVGRRIWEIAGGDWAEHVRSLTPDVLSEQQPDRRDVICEREDGTRFFVDLVLSPIVDEESGLIGISAIARDITDREQAYQQLRDVNENLELLVTQRTAELARSNHDLQRFADVASHDLQEPLRTITSFCNLLEDKYQDKLDDKGVEYLQHVVKGAERMGELIDDLLIYSRVAMDEKLFDRIDSGEAVDAAVENLRAGIVESEASVIYKELPVVMAERSQLVLVFQNLIGNAIKYRSYRPLAIQIRAESLPEMWQFSVADNGIGIDSAYWDRIFELFKRLHPHHVFEGTGIGLATCKRIVERLGGTIWIASEPGVGSEFFFTIPKHDQDGETT